MKKPGEIIARVRERESKAHCRRIELLKLEYQQALRSANRAEFESCRERDDAAIQRLAALSSRYAASGQRPGRAGQIAAAQNAFYSPPVNCGDIVFVPASEPRPPFWKRWFA